MAYRDPEKRRQKERAYREKNRDKIRERQRAYRLRTGDAASRKYKQRNKAKRNAYRIQRDYGITIQQFEDTVQLQQGKCFICQEHMVPPQIDHNHATKAFRALLCRPCNTSLGLMRENPTLLREAAAYLEAFNE